MGARQLPLRARRRSPAPGDATATRFVLEVEIPPNVGATVILPAGDGGLAESGGDAAQADGVHSVARAGGTWRVEVGSGTYRFESA